MTTTSTVAGGPAGTFPAHSRAASVRWVPGTDSTNRAPDLSFRLQRSLRWNSCDTAVNVRRTVAAFPPVLLGMMNRGRVGRRAGGNSTNDNECCRNSTGRVSSIDPTSQDPGQRAKQFAAKSDVAKFRKSFDRVRPMVYPFSSWYWALIEQSAQEQNCDVLYFNIWSFDSFVAQWFRL